MKSTKYVKHRRSRYKFPTKPEFKKPPTFGKHTARRDIENKLGRKLHPETIERHTRFQWVFCEPKGSVCSGSQ